MSLFKSVMAFAISEKPMARFLAAICGVLLAPAAMAMGAPIELPSNPAPVAAMPAISQDLANYDLNDQATFQSLLKRGTTRHATRQNKKNLQRFVYMKAGLSGQSLEAKVDGILGRDSWQHISLAKQAFGNNASNQFTSVKIDIQLPPTSNPASSFFKIGGNKTDVHSGYGYRVMSWSRVQNIGGDTYLPVHKGMDRTAPGIDGKPIYYSPKKGEVVFSRVITNGGNAVGIADPDNCIMYVSMHHRDKVLSTGQQITEGDIIGHVGQTGRVTGPHAHLETRIMGWTITGSLQLYAPDPEIVDDMVRSGKTMCKSENVDEAINRTWETKRVPALLQGSQNLSDYSIEELAKKMGLSDNRLAGQSYSVTPAPAFTRAATSFLLGPNARINSESLDKGTAALFQASFTP